MPPTSPQWQRVAVNIARLPEWNTGKSISTSLRWVPPV